MSKDVTLLLTTEQNHQHKALFYFYINLDSKITNILKTQLSKTKTLDVLKSYCVYIYVYVCVCV